MGGASDRKYGNRGSRKTRRSDLLILELVLALGVEVEDGVVVEDLPVVLGGQEGLVRGHRLAEVG